jgi:multimeric flavodoxin WrbA
MKVVTLLGSPNKNGKTGEALGMFEENLISKGHEVERIHLTDYTINGCVGCYACMQKKDELICALKDDAKAIFERMISADIIVYASPIYVFDFTSQMKALIDRHLCLTIDYGSPNQSSFINGKSVALLVTCAGSAEENADLVQMIFDRSMTSVLKCNVIGKYIIPLSEFPDFNDRAKEITVKLAKDIVSSQH